MTQRVLLVVSVLDGSGPGRVLTTLAEHLPSEWEPVLVATHGVRESPMITEARGAGIAVEHLGMRGMWDVAGAARFARLVRRCRPTVVHTRTIRADLVGRLATPFGVPVINNLVNLYPDDSTALHGRLAGQVLTGVVRTTRRAARLLVANANAVAENARETFGAPDDRVRVIYDGIDLTRWRAAAPADLSAVGVGSSDPVAATVARLHPQKGLEDLVAAAALLRNEPSLHFVVVGDGPDHAALQRAIDSADLADRLHLLGHRDDVAAVLARADVFVLPSRFEGLPSAIIEAMAAGLPVVATDVGGVRELVDHGRTGWLVPAASPVALADAIRTALRADVAAVGAAGRSKATSMFDADVMTARFVETYAEVAA